MNLLDLPNAHLFSGLCDLPFLKSRVSLPNNSFTSNKTSTTRYLQSLSITHRKERWQKILNKPEDNAYTLVAEIEGKVVGFCSVDKSRSEDMSKDTGELWAIYVDKNYEGKGIGTTLLNKGLDNLRDRGFKKAILWVLTSNYKTRKWYESKGWRVEGKTTIDKRDGLELEETRYIVDL